MSDNMCRVCLCSDRRMYAISKTVLQEMWEKLTNVQFNTNYGKPCHVCYICCAQLKKCSQLRERALKAEEWLTSFFNNGSKLSQESISSIASLTNDLDSMSSIKELFQFEYKQFNSDTVAHIKRENEEEYEEHDQEENDINIKEEVDSEEEIKREHEEEYEEHDQEENDIKIKEEDSYQEENLDAFYDEPGTRSDENVPLTSSNILRREVRIVLEKIDREAPRRKRILNLVQQKTKRIKLEETFEDKNILANAVLNSIPNNCKPHVPSFSKHLSVCMDVDNFESKSAINCSLENKISLNVNVPPENVIVENKTPTSRLSHNDVKNVISKQYLQKNADEVASSTRKDGCDQGETSNVFNRSAPANKFFCHTCQYVCVSERELNTHLCRHTGEKLSLYDNSSLIKDDLQTRVNNENTKEKNFSCHICQYKCVRKYELSIHLRKHTGEKPYTCDFCDYACSAKKNLQSHLKYKHTKEKKFACHVCEYKCVEKKDLNRHQRTHTGEKPYSCDLCEFSCSHKKSLKSHSKHKHTKEKNFACHICQYKCVEKKELNRHLRKHTGEKRYTCDLCDYACLEKASLNNHLKYKHTKEKNFSCDICGYKCVTKGDLNRHLRKHTPDKPFTCDLCEYACLEKCNLKRHLMYKHTKEKKFSCDICGYKFVAKGDLNSHLPIHATEKPYACDLCDYACSTKFRLKQHFKCKHTEEKTSVINVNTNVL